MLGGYYRFYPGDYLRDTQSLSMTEHGAYHLLLHNYYATQGCISADPDRLNRLCHATGDADRMAVAYVVATFFQVVDGKLVNKRADLEMEARAAFCAKQTENAKKGADARWKKNGSGSMPNGMPLGKPTAMPNDALPGPGPGPGPGPLPLPRPIPKDQKLSDAPHGAPPYEEIISHLNEKAGTAFKASGKGTRSHIHARWEEGFTLDQFRAVIDKKCAQWKFNPDMDKYLRPQTIFGTKFESYLNEKEVTRNGPGTKGQYGERPADGGPKAEPGKYDHLAVVVPEAES